MRPGSVGVGGVTEFSYGANGELGGGATSNDIRTLDDTIAKGFNAQIGTMDKGFDDLAGNQQKQYSQADLGFGALTGLGQQQLQATTGIGQLMQTQQNQQQNQYNQQQNRGLLARSGLGLGFGLGYRSF